MGWLEKLIDAGPWTALALTGLVGACIVGGLVYIVFKLVQRGNGKGNGAGLQHALKLDDRVDILEDKVSQVVAGLGYLKDEVRDHSTRVNDRIDKLISQLNK